MESKLKIPMDEILLHTFEESSALGALCLRAEARAHWK